MVQKGEGNTRTVVPLWSYVQYPRGDSNARTWLRRPLLYPLSYGGSSTAVYHNLPDLANTRINESTFKHAISHQP